MQLIFIKLRKIREELNFTQQQLGEYLQVQKTAITHLESEKSSRNSKQEKRIPTAYLQLIVEKGIDLNWLYDNNDQRDYVVYKKNAANTMAAEEQMPYIKQCSNCKIKDEKIASLEAQLSQIQDVLTPNKIKKTG